MTIKKITVEDFVKLIETNFKEYVGKISRIDLKWGQWSVIMNKEILKRIDENDSEAPALSMVFNYWMTMSQLLEMLYAYEKKGRLYKIFNQKKVGMKVEEARMLREAFEL